MILQWNVAISVTSELLPLKYFPAQRAVSNSLEEKMIVVLRGHNQFGMNNTGAKINNFR